MSMLKFKNDAVSNTQLSLKLKVLFMNLIAERGETDPNYAYTYFSVKRVGDYLLGKGYFHEMDEYYDLTGFEVEYEYQWPFMDKPKTTCRFCSIWTDGTHHAYAPVDFTESYQEFGNNSFFENGYGDRVEIEKVLIPSHKVNEFLSGMCEPFDGDFDAFMDFLAPSYKPSFTN